uniref:BTB domain-containing protein n=1 Tax=Meloidogyne enterolobii TaxID=390850 RepID=A0A6V7VBT3_MELEN|nr:unnamed protein product [Meloidogyne enterolobii]
MGDNNYLQDYNTTGNVPEHFVQQFTHQPHPNPSSHQFGQTFTPISGGIPQQPFTPSLPSLRPDSPLGGTDRLVVGGQTIQTQIASPLDLFIDFTRPDGQRTRPLLVEGKRLYVDEHYVSVWSPVLRSWCVECPDRELILANVQYDHVLEVLSAIHPTYKEVDDQTVHLLLPIAFDYQMDGLLHRCECFLIANKMPFLEKLWLADRYQLSRLLALLLKELRPNTHKLDLSGPRYSSLSDRVKVLLLERMHGSPAPEELPEPPIDMEHMLSPSDLNFASVRAKTGRAYHVNPYYVAAWSTLFQERFCNGIGVGGDDDLIYCPCSNEELKYFLMAIYPPQLRITESNIAPILMAACKLESHGLLRKCATILLSSQTQLSVFVRLSLLDRCRLQELLEQCMQMVQRAEDIMEMTQQQTYECLSTRAKSAMMDRFAQLVNIQGIQQFPLQSTIHICTKCKSQFSCSEIAWQCSQCKTFISSTLLAELSGAGRQNRQGSQSGMNPSPQPLNTSPSHTQQYGRNIVSSRR